ncbi:immunoglobulin-like domain-containing protein [Anaerobium acetethylicum]|uniref:Pesticidal crystal protein Cry22Aa Ig-like domain-containing protein n=1 Tax=Anaerobium acetethylicum TaxID=1619234 RepID=A0A1D3TRA8_9FIRM|nr:immunoglobulin-like domain-containing protein [Anaerobium acetethylicum]SCP96244.1 hypothetical protein SAMN05421730_100438 [Anaerobium acetethylicum]
MRKTAIVGISCFIVMVLAGMGIYMIAAEDRKGPEIVFDSREISYRKGGDEALLLEGVTAVDEREGDVSDSLIVESIIPFIDGDTLKVIYAAKDGSNNITKSSRVITYRSDSEADEEEGAEAGEEDAGAATAGESGDGEEEKDTKSKDAKDSNTVDSEGNDDVEGEMPALVLTVNKVTLKKGEAFNYMNYIESITDNEDDERTLFRRLRVNGDAVDTDTTGTYEILISVVDTDGNRSEAETLIVNVVK